MHARAACMRVRRGSTLLDTSDCELPVERMHLAGLLGRAGLSGPSGFAAAVAGAVADGAAALNKARPVAPGGHAAEVALATAWAAHVATKAAAASSAQQQGGQQQPERDCPSPPGHADGDSGPDSEGGRPLSLLGAPGGSDDDDGSEAPQSPLPARPAPESHTPGVLAPEGSGSNRGLEGGHGVLVPGREDDTSMSWHTADGLGPMAMAMALGPCGGGGASPRGPPAPPPQGPSRGPPASPFGAEAGADRAKAAALYPVVLRTYVVLEYADLGCLQVGMGGTCVCVWMCVSYPMVGCVPLHGRLWALQAS
jgi:hypothetical protein